MLRVAVALLVLLVPSAARAEARFALLIGNQGYADSVGPLRNLSNDVALVGRALLNVSGHPSSRPVFADDVGLAVARPHGSPLVRKQEREQRDARTAKLQDCATVAHDSYERLVDPTTPPRAASLSR
jgi:hypothetical protein